MKSKTNGSGTMQTAQKMNHFQGEGTNWVLVVGGALLSTLSIKLGCHLKRVFDNKQHEKASKENRKHAANRRSRTRGLHSNAYHFTQDESLHPSFLSESSRGAHVEQPRSPSIKDGDNSLPLVKVPAAETSNGSNGIILASPPDRLELPWKPFHRSNCSDSCISESGSDIYSKKEVIQKLRQQLKRREEMIMEMQAQITDMQNSLHIQMKQTARLQAQVDAANKELFDSEREIQHLREVISNHRVAEVVSPDKPLVKRSRQSESTNDQVNDYTDSVDDLELHCVGVDKGKVDRVNVEMLKTAVCELKEVIEGKDFLLKSYKEQKTELFSKIKELQLKLVSHVPTILQ